MQDRRKPLKLSSLHGDDPHTPALVLKSSCQQHNMEALMSRTFWFSFLYTHSTHHPLKHCHKPVVLPDGHAPVQQNDAPCHTAKTAREWPQSSRPWSGFKIAPLLIQLYIHETSPNKSDLTSKNTELKGSATNALVPETTGKYQRTWIHVLICQSPVRSMIEPPWIRLVQERPTNA